MKTPPIMPTKNDTIQLVITTSIVSTPHMIEPSRYREQTIIEAPCEARTRDRSLEGSRVTATPRAQISHLQPQRLIYQTFQSVNLLKKNFLKFVL